MFDLHLREGSTSRFPECMYRWDKLRRYNFDDIDESPGKLVDRLAMVFYTVNSYTSNLSNGAKIQQGAAVGGSNGFVNNARVSYNLVAVGVIA